MLILDLFFFFFNDTATTEIYTLSLHDALPICSLGMQRCVLVGDLRSLRRQHRRQRQRHRQPEKLTGHTTSSIIVISGPCLAGVLGRSGHSRASRRARARLRAISLRQADTDWFVVATNRAAVRQR